MSKSVQWFSDMRQSIQYSKEERRSIRESYAKPVWVHVLITVLIVVIVLVQGIIMNFYYIDRYGNSVLPYLWFGGDICIAFAFLGTLLEAHTYLRKRRRGSYGMVGVGIEHKLVWHPGILPLSYISWLFYSSIVVIKIVLMIHFDIVVKLTFHEQFGSAAIQVALALSGFVYMLLVEGHVWAPPGTMRYMLATYVCTNTAIEIVDTASLINFIQTYANSTLLGDVANDLKMPIEFLCVTTFFLPTMMLYQMTISDFQVEIMEGPLGTLYDFLHIFLLDLPIIVVRIYLWVHDDHYSSVYLMRNVFSALVIGRRLISEFSDLLFMCQYVSKHPVYSSPSVYVETYRKETDEDDDNGSISSKPGSASLKPGSILEHSASTSSKPASISNEPPEVQAPRRSILKSSPRPISQLEETFDNSFIP